MPTARSSTERPARRPACAAGRATSGTCSGSASGARVRRRTRCRVAGRARGRRSPLAVGRSCRRSCRAPSAAPGSAFDARPAAADRRWPASWRSPSSRRSRPAVAASCSRATRPSPYPISPTTDHLGALLLAPLNIAWLIQAWVLLGSMAYAFGPDKLCPGPGGRSLLWLVFAHRARPGGRLDRWRRYAAARTASAIARGAPGLLGLAVAALVQLTGHTGRRPRPDPDPVVLPGRASAAGAGAGGVVLGRRWLVEPGRGGRARRLPAHARRAADAARRGPARDRPARAARRCRARVLGLLIRTDRASVWRSVPMRRGMLVLAIGPGPRRDRRQPAVALDDDPARAWSPPVAPCSSASTPGASTAAAPCGARACPVPASALFDARACVLAEFLPPPR